jgi:hypothetical protein
VGASSTGAGSAGIASSRWHKFDTAVTDLWQQSQQGLVSGQVLGRLHNIACVTQPDHVSPVNAVLADSGCLGPGWVAVSERATALAVVAHFQAQKVGIATCKVGGSKWAPVTV